MGLPACYALDRTQLVAALEGILRTKEVSVENADVVWRATRRYRDSSADFADCLIERAADAAGCTKTMTFDRGAAKSGGMVLIQKALGRSCNGYIARLDSVCM